MTVNVNLEWVGTNWSAYAPDLDDVVVATGKTREETIQRFRDALLGLLEYQRTQGKDVPVVTALDIHERREIATLEPSFARAA